MSKKRRHEEHEEHVDESWLVPYADILTLLLALFIVLYSMNSVDQKKFEELSQAFSIAFSSGQSVLDMPSIVERGPDIRTELGGKEDATEQGMTEKEPLSEAEMEQVIEQSKTELNELKQQIDQYIADNGLTTSLETSLNMSQLLITIRDNALFNSAEATVNREGQELAVSIAEMLENYPDFNIEIAGHTDNSPISTAQFRSNWDLSVMRAVRFMDIMLENDALDPKRFSAIGYGEHHPVASNDTAEGKAKNRRVEVSIVHNYVDMVKQQSLSVNEQQASN
ncbi:flagellar motor protein MotB [Paenibacillus montaniterrae]|uniref:Flagellar motor protein MotB n=1 Tax=Paenibacillus montaniterrae TaxID=429341 RepID=A0A919YV36_9BACL|nr:flagellar motor protein MotB [Paenibacillus montaniterrae]GIP19019.1 flagellar motor protein MotB [Paenibacillus montaniterrae]